MEYFLDANTLHDILWITIYLRTASPTKLPCHDNKKIFHQRYNEATITDDD